MTAAAEQKRRQILVLVERPPLVEAAGSTRLASPRPFSCQWALSHARLDRGLIRRTLKSQVTVRAGLGPGLVTLVDCLPAHVGNRAGRWAHTIEAHPWWCVEGGRRSILEGRHHEVAEHRSSDVAAGLVVA